MILSSAQQRKLSAVCRASVDDFIPLGTRHATTPDGPAIFIDNGGSTLAVGHLDHVLWHTPTFQGDRIQCGQLDDRLGVWAILDYLPTLTNKPYDILLCDSEEVGRSTAGYAGFDGSSPLVLPKRYNWVWELDRAGTDVVTYQYNSPDWHDALESAGFSLGWGSFSDISALEHLGLSAVNVGVGYHGQHSANCYGELSETIAQCRQFAEFLEMYHDTPFPHQSDDRWDDEQWDRWEDMGGSPGLFPCPHCGEPLEWQARWNFCPICGSSL